MLHLTEESQSTVHVHCKEIWALIKVYLEQKIMTEVQLHHPSLAQRERFIKQISTLLGIKPETAACKPVILPLHHSSEWSVKVET